MLCLGLKIGRNHLFRTSEHNLEGEVVLKQERAGRDYLSENKRKVQWCQKQDMVRNHSV